MERMTAIANPIAINVCGTNHKNPNEATMHARIAVAFKHPNMNVEKR